MAYRSISQVPALVGFFLLAGLFLNNPEVTRLAAQVTTPQVQETPAKSANVSLPQNSPELTSRDTTATFKVNVRLVQLRVIVRDSQGNAIGTLQKENFQLSDGGKPQIITKFEVERSPAPTVEGGTSSTPAVPSAVVSPSEPQVAERYIAYVFDDIHLEFSDLAQVGQAAQRHLGTLQATDRAAIFTTSGQGNLDFTDDRSKLNDTLLRLSPHPVSIHETSPCPKMSYYLADQIVNREDRGAIAVAVNDVLACMFQNDLSTDLPGGPLVIQQSAVALANSAAQSTLATGNIETRAALASIKEIVRRLSLLPGKRQMVLISPGFIAPGRESDIDAIIENAVRSNITISAMNGRGLYVQMPFGDASQGDIPPIQSGIEAMRYQHEGDVDADDLLADLAEGTGGLFFQNSNDLVEGLRRTASTPEFSYLLGFTPQNLKLNGVFHKLKVTLKDVPQKLSIQARRGYFAPSGPANREQQANQEIEEALFSRDAMHDLPIDIHTQYFKPSDNAAKLTVLAHIDVKPLHFRKVDGRNSNNLTIVSGVFDRNGNWVTGSEKILEMHFKDDTLIYKMNSGLDIRSSYDVKPGGYTVRLVVRDEEGQIAAENGVVQIP